MEDEAIVALYWARDEGAIPATAEKYGAYCAAIAGNILESPQDAEECVNDTYLSAWNAMPPHRPARLATFLGKLTRNLSFNRYKARRADKRGSGQLPLVLDELGECVSGREDVEETVDRKELIRALDDFLTTLPRRSRDLFVRRYWYADPIAAIARRYGRTEGSVAMDLSRTRRKLKAYLTERGFDL